MNTYFFPYRIQKFRNYFLRSVFFLCVILLSFEKAHALSAEQVTLLKNAATEMCETPTKKGEKFEVKGIAKGGVIVKLIGANIEAKLSKKSWTGIEQIRETQADRLKCVQEIIRIMAPLMKKKESAIENASLKPLNKGLITHWVMIGNEKSPRLLISNPECIVLVWLTNVVIDNDRPPSTLYKPTDSHLVALPFEVFDHTFKLGETRLIIDAYLSTDYFSQEKLAKHYNGPGNSIQLQLVMRKHWGDNGACNGSYTLEYVRND